MDIFSYSVNILDDSLNNIIATNNFNFHVVIGDDVSRNAVLRDYAITGTPSMFLLNEKREIISKPINYFDLIKSLNAIGVL